MSTWRLRVGPLLVCICIALYRTVWLSAQLSGVNLSEIAYLLLADVPVIGVLGVLAVAEGALPRRWRFVAVSLMIVLMVVYLADVLVVLGLNARLQISDIRQFASEVWVVRGFAGSWALVLVLAAAASFFLKLSPGALPPRLLLIGASLLVFLPMGVRAHLVPPHLQKYSGSILLLGREIWSSTRPVVSRYVPGDVAAYRGQYEALFDAPFARTRKDIILIVVESLSASDSLRTAGIRDGLRRFDDLSRQGILFRNFYANFEASEGGIVALLSGVPPMHFPSASTNTFAEYALQPSVVEAFTRQGYQTEFLTSVPLQFISMDAYLKSENLGFRHVAGQREIPRFTQAPRFAFESPADHVLYQEVLERFDSLGGGRRAPILLAAVTASSHAPYVDPLNRRSTAENIWSYVEDELWWLHKELADRGFFENGLLVITGDHRKMLPLTQAERTAFGDSAKARIPLVIIGKDVPRGVVDDRLFQQADLLRMLDRAVDPGSPLSPFVIWVERYVFVFGVASNASNLQVFDGSNGGRQAYHLNLHGAEIQWHTRAPNALAVERAIHRQRALQQSVRASRMTHAALNFGRDLSPSADRRGMLVGLSTDTDLSRDPDSPRGDLKTASWDSFEGEGIFKATGKSADQFTLSARGFLSIPADGDYWFSMFADDEGCLAIDKELVLGCQSGVNEGVALLTAGLHRFDLRYVNRGGARALRLTWLPPGAKSFTNVPREVLVAPELEPKTSM